VDAVRYWLLRHVPATGDADFSDDAFTRAYSAELADDLGNLVSRVAGMLHRYRDGALPAPGPSGPTGLRTAAERLPAELGRALEAYDPRAALDAVFVLVTGANRHVEGTQPWTLAREGDAAARRLDTVLYELAEVCRLVAEGLRPFLPGTAERIAAALGQPLAVSWRDGLRWGGMRPGQRVSVPAPLFPRRDLATAGPGVPASAGPVSDLRGSAGTGARPPGA
jgi:methionyl-tRNA synthetase